MLTADHYSGRGIGVRGEKLERQRGREVFYWSRVSLSGAQRPLVLRVHVERQHVPGIKRLAIEGLDVEWCDLAVGKAPLQRVVEIMPVQGVKPVRIQRAWGVVSRSCLLSSLRGSCAQSLPRWMEKEPEQECVATGSKS